MKETKKTAKKPKKKEEKEEVEIVEEEKEKEGEYKVKKKPELTPVIKEKLKNVIDIIWPEPRSCAWASFKVAPFFEWAGLGFCFTHRIFMGLFYGKAPNRCVVAFFK